MHGFKGLFGFVLKNKKPVKTGLVFERLLSVLFFLLVLKMIVF